MDIVKDLEKLASVYGPSGFEDQVVKTALEMMTPYVDETWNPKDAEDKAKMLAMEAVHLESLEAIIRMAQMNECIDINKLEKIENQAKKHYLGYTARPRAPYSMRKR